MCGFVGFIDRQGLMEPEKTLTKMSLEIVHRGPDDFGIWIEKKNNFYIAFRRLSILDLSEAGHQPMHSRSGRYVVCFNGEIYNHLEIRETLLKEFGYSDWVSSSDTETLLAAIEFYGLSKALKLCVGMFAIALMDRHTDTLSLARDRFGEKPLYYGWSGNSIIFGSELGALKKYDYFPNKISMKAAQYFLNYSYVPSPMSIYENVYKVQPSEIVSIDVKQNKVKLKEVFWDLEQEIDKSKNNCFSTYEEGIEELEKVLKDSIKLQMIADVPLGVFLSGGIDSSLITSVMQEISMNKIKTFTVGFENKNYDESVHASNVARHLNTDHTNIEVSENEALEVIPRLPEYYTEPFADSSQIPTFLVSKIAKKRVTVALSGDGGDELFGGYTRYLWGERIWNKIAIIPFPLRKLLGKLIYETPESAFLFIEKILGQSNKSDGVSFINDKAKKLARRLSHIHSDIDLYNSLATQWNSLNHLLCNEVEPLKYPFLEHKKLSGLSFKENMMYWDISSYLKDDILTKVDRASMSNSLETRAPFLDHRLARTAFRFNDQMLIQNGIGKMPLRAILEKYIPKEITDRPKSGFGIPVGAWIRSELKEWACSLLNEDLIKSHGILNNAEVQKIWLQHLDGRQDHTVRLWNILMLTAWIDRN